MWLLIARHWDKIVLLLLVAAVLGWVYVRGRSDERANWKPKYDLLQTTLNTERESHKQAMEAERVRRERAPRVHEVVPRQAPPHSFSGA